MEAAATPDVIGDTETNGCCDGEDGGGLPIVSSSRWSSCASLGKASVSNVLGLSNPSSPTMASKCDQSPKSSRLSSGGGGGPRYKLIVEGDIQLCRLNHTRTIVSKIMNSKYLRRWETHHLVLGQFAVSSVTVGSSFVRIYA